MSNGNLVNCVNSTKDWSTGVFSCDGSDLGVGVGVGLGIGAGVGVGSVQVSVSAQKVRVVEYRQEIVM